VVGFRVKMEQLDLSTFHLIDRTTCTSGIIHKSTTRQMNKIQETKNEGKRLGIPIIPKREVYRYIKMENNRERLRGVLEERRKQKEKTQQNG